MTQNNTEQPEEKVQIEAETFVCPSCASALRYDSKKDKFLCPSCGYVREVKSNNSTVREYDFNTYAQREKESVPFLGLVVTDCQNCGAEVTFDASESATVCPMCGSTQIATAKQRCGIPPEGVIPFQFDKQDADAKFRDWIKHLWFAPNAVKVSAQEGKLSGNFIPFWTYDATAVAPYTGEGGRTRTEEDEEGHTKTVTDWYPTSGVVTMSFDDILVCASRNEVSQVAASVAPYHTTQALKPFAPEYLAGYHAEVYSIKADEGFEQGKHEMEQALSSEAERDIRRFYDSSRFVQVFPKYTDVTYKHVLLPVWTSVFAYAGKTYRYAINGETGSVSGDRPYSVPKILIAVAALIAVIAGIFGIFYMLDDDDAEEVAAVPAPQAVVLEAAAPTADAAFLAQFEETAQV